MQRGDVKTGNTSAAAPAPARSSSGQQVSGLARQVLGCRADKVSPDVGLWTTCEPSERHEPVPLSSTRDAARRTEGEACEDGRREQSGEAGERGRGGRRGGDEPHQRQERGPRGAVAMQRLLGDVPDDMRLCRGLYVRWSTLMVTCVQAH